MDGHIELEHVNGYTIYGDLKNSAVNKLHGGNNIFSGEIQGEVLVCADGNDVDYWPFDSYDEAVEWCESH